MLKCNCFEPSVLVCDSHISSHLQAYPSNKHVMIPLGLTVEDSQIPKTSLEIHKSLANLDQLKLASIEETKQIISMINFNQATFLNFICEMQQELQRFLEKIHNKHPVDIELLERIISGEFSSYYLPGVTEEVNRDLKNIYTIKSTIQNEYDYAFIFASNSQPSVINLSSLSKSVISFAPILEELVQFTRIDSDKYFANGGWNGSMAGGASFVLDMRKMQYTTLGSTYPNCAGGCVYKEKKVYFFGGLGYDGNTPLAQCYSYELETGIMACLPKLPQPSYDNMAGLCSNEIYVCGYSLNKVLIYDGKGFRESVCVKGNSFKVVADGWVVADGKLFEIGNANWAEWPAYAVNYTPTALNSYCTYRRREFVYFLQQDLGLKRINTVSKRIEAVEYS
jgi:hypothetical protein